MDPSIPDMLLELSMNILGVILGGGVVIVFVWWVRSRGIGRSNLLFANAVLREMTLERGSSAIDIGCGTGWASRRLAGIAADADVVGVDISETAVKRAHRLISRDKLGAGTNLAYVAANVESLPCRSHCLDHATCIVSFSWFSHPHQALAEMARILRPSGKLYIADVCKDDLLSRVVTTLCNRISAGEENLYSAEAYREFLGRRFEDVYQERLSPLGGLLTVGARPRTTGSSGDGSASSNGW